MIRTCRTWMAIVTIAGAVVGVGCHDKDKIEYASAPPPAPPPPVKPPAPSDGMPPPPTWPQPGRSCNSRFAIVETERPTCDEQIAPGWKLFPRRQPTRQVPPTSYDKSRGGKDKSYKDKSYKDKDDKGDADKRPPVLPTDVRRASRRSRPFCVYEWTSKELPTIAQFSQIHATQECALAVGMAGENPDVEWPFYGRNFDRQVKAIATSDLPKNASWLEKTDERAPVVAVLDTSPFGVTKEDVSGHGYAVSRVIGHLSCIGGADGPTCKDLVRPYVAMPLVPKPGMDGQWETGPNGGYIGYFHDLFDAFDEALADRRGRHLIVNLSLGWDPATTDPHGPEVRQMRDLLERAYCEGVLVIGAAGNGTTASQAPVLPAAFESDDGSGATPGLPDARRCNADLGIADAKPPAGGYRPLIHAVGSVDLYDERLPTVRAWAHPRIATYGIAVTVPEPPNATYKYSRPRSGTSMSAAAVSGIAAAVWRANEHLDPAQVMDAVYKGGYLLETKNRGSRTESCLDTGHDRCHSWPARRVTLCGALNKVLGTGKLTCVTPVHPDRDDPATAGTYFPPRPTDPPAPPTVTTPCGTTNCGVPIGAPGAQGTALVGPMGVATCGSCIMLTNGGNGLLAGNMIFNGTPPSSFYTTVVIYDSHWGPHYYYPFAWASPVGWFWQGLPAGATDDVIAAEIDWTYYAGSFWWMDGASLQIVP